MADAMDYVPLEVWTWDKVPANHRRLHILSQSLTAISILQAA